MTPQQIQQLIDQAIKSKVPDMIQGHFDSNYYSGAPKIPPHTHNGVDNLKINATSFTNQWQLPIGSLYLSVVSTNPATLLGYGTWVAYAAGEVLVGFSAGDPNFGTLGGTGGEATHTLTTAEIPAHSHRINSGGTGGALDSGAGTAGFNAGANGTVNSVQFNTGGGGAHNNIQPYVTVSIWQRTA